MKNFLIALFAVICLSAGDNIRAAVSPISPEIDLLNKFTPDVIIKPSGYVIIEAININRPQATATGEPIAISPDYSEAQIGNYYDYRRGWWRAVTVRDSDVEQFVRDAVSLGFLHSDFVVIEAGDEHAEEATKITVDLNRLWIWVTQKSKSSTIKTFHFEIETFVSSDAPEFAAIGTVKASGFKKGGNGARTGAYSTTVLEIMDVYLNNFEDQVRNTASSLLATTDAKDNTPSVANLSETLAELEALHADGEITDEELAILKRKAIDQQLQ